MKKYLSRKFLLSLLGAIGGLAAVFVEVGGEVGSIAGIIMAVVSVLTYIITEGVIDAKAVLMAQDVVADTLEFAEDSQKIGFQVKEGE